MDAMGGQGAHVLTSLEVPFYHQSFDFTCGPASLIMALGHFDPKLAPTRELEIDIWREANLVEVYAASRQGLALAAHRRGFRVRTQGNAKAIELLECLGLAIADENRAVATALHEDLKERAARAGIKDEIKPVTLQDIEAWLHRGWVPLILIDARLTGDEAIPHWVVPTGITTQDVVLHDPDQQTGNLAVRREAFERWLGFDGVSCAVIVEGIR